MPKLVTVQEPGNVVWTLLDGELTPWQIKKDGNLIRLEGDAFWEAYRNLPEEQSARRTTPSAIEVPL